MNKVVLFGQILSYQCATLLHDKGFLLYRHRKRGKSKRVYVSRRGN